MKLSYRLSLAFLLAAVSGAASAIGLGDLRAQPALGDRLDLAINLVGVEHSLPDASCFRLTRPPAGDALPWLQEAELSVVPGKPPILQIRSTQLLREPLLQFGIQVACGFEIKREYILLPSPPIEKSSAAIIMADSVAGSTPDKSLRSAPSDAQKSTPATPSASSAGGAQKPDGLATRSPQRTGVQKAESSDRLMLSGAGEGETSSRLARFFEQQLIAAEPDAKRRELLRQEFYKLLAAEKKTGEETESTAEATEKLSHMEAELLELRENIRGLSDGSVVSSGEVAAPAVMENQAQEARLQELPQIRTEAPVLEHAEASSLTDWMLYGLLFGIVLGVAGWLSWGAYRDRIARRGFADDQEIDRFPAAIQNERPAVPRSAGAASFDLVPDMPSGIEVKMEANEAPLPPLSAIGKTDDKSLSIGGASIEDDSEISPVMELADIMLSFGRVKGAAQALQEFVDNNPQEALQPWIRLMDVYRMAGMREEFEQVARNLNRNFNVAIQSWDAIANASGPLDSVLLSDDAKPAVQGVEDMPGIISSIIRMWDSDDVVGYLYQLLRDNRSGQRQGFALPVVEEILFLIELKDTANRMSAESADNG